MRLSKLNDLGQEEYQIMNLNENEEGESVQVTVTIEYAQLRPLSNILGMAPENLSSSAVMERLN